MAGSRTQGPPDAGRHLILYDGVCGLCSRLLQFVIAHDRDAIFRFASLQSSFGQATVERMGGVPAEIGTFFLIAEYKTSRAIAFTRSRGVMVVLEELGWPWKLATAARVVPQPLLDCAYDLVARNRYRLFGRLETCLVPSPDVRKRFVGDRNATGRDSE